MYDFAKPLQISTPGFAPHFRGFDVKLHWHKQTKVFAILVLKTKKEREREMESTFSFVYKNPSSLDLHWLESNIQNKLCFPLKCNTYTHSLFLSAHTKHFFSNSLTESTSREMCINVLKYTTALCDIGCLS